MSQQQSPWVEGAYGWSFGESGWNPGMDQNLLKFSFLFDRNVDSIVASLPPAVNGQAHYNTVDSRLYFAVGTTYYSCPVPKWFSVIVKPSGDVWQFNGVNLVQIDSPSDLDIRLDSLELTASQLGTAAFEDVAFFASQSALDVVEANSQAYTDVLRTDLADSVDQTKGASLVGFDPALIYPTTTVGGYLNYTPSLNPIIVYDWDDSTGTDNSTAFQAYVDSTYVSPTVVVGYINAGSKPTRDAPFVWSTLSAKSVRKTSVYAWLLASTTSSADCEAKKATSSKAAVPSWEAVNSSESNLISKSDGLSICTRFTPLNCQTSPLGLTITENHLGTGQL